MALTGTETLQVLGQASTGSPAATTQTTTTGAIAALASTEASPLVSTAISTVGNGTLTAAGLVGGQIVRSGPVAAYTDTTATATQIVAALPGFITGSTFLVRLKNTTAFTQTISAGTGITLPVTVIIPAFSVGNYFVTINSATTATFTHLNTIPIANGTTLTASSTTAVSTVGAATLTSANFVGGITIRSGSQAATAFTDTTDTAANIIAACSNLVNKIGASFIYYYQNTTNAPATITGGTGVTVSGYTVVQANSTVAYLITYTAANTLTMVGFYGTANSTIGTFTANGATAVVVANTAVSPNSQIGFTLKTVGGTPAGAPFSSAITAGTGFSVKAAAGDTSVYNYEIRW